MPDTPSVPAERASGFGLTLVFLAYLTGYHILLFGLNWLTARFLGDAGGADWMGIRSAFAGFVAGMGVGKYWLRHEGAKPSSGRAWLMACLWALVTVFLAAMIWLGPMGLSFKDNLFDNALLFVRNLIVICLMVRIGLWSGFRQSEETAAPP